jgi:hypothetical protein
MCLQIGKLSEYPPVTNSIDLATLTATLVANIALVKVNNAHIVMSWVQRSHLGGV